jgi:putative FmdB family regulatory protein
MGGPGQDAGGSVPIYEYQCPDCGHQFEQLQKISDEPVRVCPNCAQTHVRKLVSQTSFVLKGGGWYKDHYGLKGGGGGKSDGTKDTPSSGPEKAGDKPAAATPAAASESKPAATSTAPTSTPSKKTPSSAA